MKRKITTILLAMLLVIGTAIGLCACANQEDIDNALIPVEQQVTLINTTLDDMKATDKTLNDSITALTGRVTVLEVELVEVNTKITSLQTDSATKAELENVKTTLQKQIDDLNDEIAELKNKDTDLKMQIDNLQDLLTVEIGNVKDWASNIFLSIENWNKAKVEIDDKISALRDRVVVIEDTLETMNTVITALQQQVEQNKQDIADLTIRVNCLEGKHVADTTIATYTWSNDFSTCTGSSTCKHCGADVSEIANSTISDYTYTVSFTNKEFSSQTIDLTNLTNMTADQQAKVMTSSDTEFVGNTFKKIFVGDIPECTTHDTEIVYKWSDDFTICTAVSECKNCFRTFADETVTDDKISLDGFVYTATFENALFSTTTLDLTDLTNFNESQYEERLEFVFSQKNADVTLTLPKDYSWDGTYSIGTITYKYYDDGTLNLTLKGVEKIKRLGSIDELKTINLPDAIEICDGAFYNCTELTKVTANNVTKIGNKAFYFCTKLKELTFESASMEIGENAFGNCFKLTKIEFSGVITEIGTDAFKNANTTNCTLVLAKGQKDFTAAADGSFTISDADVVAGTNKTFCGYTFKEIIIAEE